MTAMVICDLDGTLANVDHRLPLLEKQRWDDFYAGIPHDALNVWCWTILNGLKTQDCKIVFVTGRPEKTRDDTEAWLERVGLGGHEVFMRRDGDHRPDFVIKKSIYKRHFKDERVLFVLEDRLQVVEMWRKQGLVVLQCADGVY